MIQNAALDQDQLRQKVVEVARKHKASWIELGQYLHTIQKNKIYKYWGYLEFDHYCTKELGIKPNTALKMTRSYLYLEREEPRVIESHHSSDENPRTIPSYESVNILRLARKNPLLKEKDVAAIREHVFEEAREPKEVRAHVRRLLSDREVRDSGEVRKARRNAAIKRLISVLSNTKKELENERLLPVHILNQIDELSVKLQDQLE